LKILLNILKNKYFLNLIYLADYSNMPKSAKEPLTFANMLYNFYMVGNGRFILRVHKKRKKAAEKRFLR
jgi:hypothetical protein